MKKPVKYKFGSKLKTPVKSSVVLKSVNLSKETKPDKTTKYIDEPIEIVDLEIDKETYESSNSIIDYDPSINWDEPFKLEIDDLDKYKILALASKEQKERDLISVPIINKYKELLKIELDKALSNCPSFIKAREQKDQAIKDFLIKSYKDLPKTVFVSRLFLEEGYAECVNNEEESEKVRLLIGV